MGWGCSKSHQANNWALPVGNGTSLGSLSQCLPMKHLYIISQVTLLTLSASSSFFLSISFYSVWLCQKQNQPGKQLQKNKEIYLILFLWKKTSKRNPAVLNVWGEKRIFLQRCASSIIWQSCSHSRPMILHRNSIVMMSQGSFNLQLNPSVL